MRFRVTYEITTAESAMEGDCAESGFVHPEAVRLRAALELVQSTRTSRVGGVICIEPSDSRVPDARWFTVYNGMEFETGACESRSIHIPEQVTGASRARIFRLLDRSHQ